MEVEEIEVDGRVVVARLRPTGAGRASFWYEALLAGDNIAGSCG